MRQITLVVTSALIASLAMSSCARRDTSESGDGEDPIVIGAPVGRTGFIQAYDDPVMAGAELAVKDINADGGVLGRPLKIVYADTKSEIEQGSVAALELVDEADAFIVTVDYDFGGPAARVAQENGIVAFSGAGSPRFGKEGIGDKAFSVASGVTEAAVMAEFAYDRGWRKPYIIQDTTIEHTTLACDYFEQRWGEIAGADSITGKDTFKNDDPSIAGQVTRARNSDADFITLCSFNPGGAAAVKQIRDAGVDLPIIGPASFDGDYWLKGIPNLSDFYHTSIGSMYGDDPNDAVNNFFAEYEEKIGDRAVSSFPLLGYAAVQAFAKAVEAAGTTDGDEVRTALESFTDEQLILGPTTYTEDCHAAIGRPQPVMEIQNGETSLVEYVEPEKVPKTIC